ncbi:MAG TPA: serine hydrolase [Pyrinomonadaceae bacterium]|nr:serine hydrolase [Pyrinomonadaceae bacterium]
MKFFLILSLSLSVGNGLFTASFTPKGKAIDARQNDAPNQNSLAERIRRVESGLLPPVIFKGRNLPQMTLAERMSFYKTPGVSIAVINGGRIEWAKAYGAKENGGRQPVTPETLFQAASVSKPVAALVALRLVQEGRLKLDEDVNRYLVSWKVPENEFTKTKKVTLRGLLAHTAGLSVHGFTGFAADAKPATLLQILDGTPPANSAPVRVEAVPGTRWRYSGGGYSVLQQLLIDVAGKPFSALAREKVLLPLKMARSNFEQPLSSEWVGDVASGHLANGDKVKGGWNIYPTLAAGAMWTTASDMARFALEIQQSAQGKSNKILSTELANEMLTPQLENWGLGPTVQGAGRTRRFSHGGSTRGYRAFMVAYTETGQGAVVMTNSDNGEMLFDEILRSIAREYEWPDFQPTEKTLASVSPRVFESYVGQYEFRPNVILTITTEGGRMYGKLPGNPQAEFFPESETKYFLSVPGNPEVTFVKDARGEVTGLNLLIEGRAMTIKKLTAAKPSLNGNTTFRLKGFPNATIVAVAGSFNNWDVTRTLMSKDGDGWVCRVDLPPGKYLYKFVVDGEWIVDPENPATEKDSSGNINSVLTVASVN